MLSSAGLRDMNRRGLLDRLDRFSGREGDVLFHERGRRDLGELDLLLLEGASGRGTGGVGARLDWGALAAARERLPAGTRVGVAGGLTPANVAEAVASLRPSLVDVSSGVESAPGEKDAARVRAFVAAALEAGAREAGAGAR